MKLRKILGNFTFIHFEVFLGLFALAGVLFGKQSFLVFFVVLSFAGAVCGAFIRVIDTVKNK